jgi:hypothetical protein
MPVSVSDAGIFAFGSSFFGLSAQVARSKF